MIALDTTFLLDFLDGVDATADFLTDNAEKPFFTATLALFETYRGAAQVRGEEGLGRVVNDLDWIEPLPLNEAAALEAAQIEAELPEGGRPLYLGDILIAGVCRVHGATLVTRNGDFEAVKGLQTESY